MKSKEQGLFDSERIPKKIYKVQLGKMRVPPALVQQREFRKAHGDQIAADLDLDLFGYPILNHRDAIFWVLDGQHRLYALRQRLDLKDTDEIECEVYENLTDSQMAKIFLGRVGKAIPLFDKFHIACTAGNVVETSVRRAIESNGLKVSRKRGENSVSALGSVIRVYRRTSEVMLGQVLRALKKGFAGDPAAFDGPVIEGVGLVFNRYNGRTSEVRLASKLSDVTGGVRGLLRKAEKVRESTGNQQAFCVATVVVQIYNVGIGSNSRDRLPKWGKDDAE